MTKAATICIATFGTEDWRGKGERLRDRMVEDLSQYPACLVTYHGNTLASARNEAAEMATTEWLIFLDADDELEPGYVKALMADYTHGDLRAPAVRYVYPGGGQSSPMTFGDRDMLTMNQCVIGTAIRRSLFWDLGGFWEERAWEDWSLFRRAYLLGATITHNPDAIYRAHVNPSGRNATVYDMPGLTEQIRRSHEEWIRSYNRAE